MKKIHFLPASLIFLLFISCSNRTEFDKEQVQNQVKEMFASYVQQVNEKGIEGIEGFFSDDPRFQWVEDGIVQYPNKQALVSGIEAFFPTISSIDLRPSKVEVLVLDESLASIFVEYVEDVVLNSGYKFTLDGAMTILTVKENGTWKFLTGHSSIKKPRGDQ